MKIARSIRIETITDQVIEKLRVLKNTERLKSYNSVVEDLIEQSPEFIKMVKKLK